MNLQAIQSFVVLSKTLHFGEAAKKCFITQPTLSIQIKKLERELGVELFERDRKQVRLTSAGQRLLEQAKSLLEQARLIRATAKRYSDPFQSRITLGVIPTLAPYWMPKLLSSVVANYPQLTVALVEEKTEMLLAKLENGIIDAAVIATNAISSLHITVELGSERFYLAVSENHPLAKQPKVNSWDLRNEKILLLEEGHCLREQVLGYCLLDPTEENNDMSAASLETLLGVISAGYPGVTLVPELAVWPRAGIVFVDFSSEKAVGRPIQMLWRRGSSLKPVLQEIALLGRIDMIPKSIQNLG